MGLCQAGMKPDQAQSQGLVLIPIFEAMSADQQGQLDNISWAYRGLGPMSQIHQAENTAGNLHEEKNNGRNCNITYLEVARHYSKY